MFNTIQLLMIQFDSKGNYNNLIIHNYFAVIDIKDGGNMEDIG